MTFYQALQMDPSGLKKGIREAQDKKEKRYFIKALVVRDILLVMFAIVFISFSSEVFGSQNSAMAVVIFCMMLSIRFVDFGYKISHSLVSLGICFLILLISPIAMQLVAPPLGLIINFISLFAVVLLTCEKPEMGNGGLYLFGYIFLSGSMVTPEVFVQRIYLTIFGYLVCAAILFLKHRHKNPQTTLLHVISRYDIHSQKGQWQLQIALALSLLFFAGSYLGLNRFMWVGFACSSLLSSYPVNLHERMRDRAVGAIVGSLLFGLIYSLTPPSLSFLFGPVSGLCLGFCSNYRYKTIFNCFGALLMASSIYGVHDAVLLRIFNNLVGLLFGCVFFYIFQKILVKRWLGNKELKHC